METHATIQSLAGGGRCKSALLTGDPAYYGDGSNVDAIVCDESGWYGHIEFINTADSRVTEPGETSKQPVNFKGTNVLKEGFAPSDNYWCMWGSRCYSRCTILY